MTTNTLSIALEVLCAAVAIASAASAVSPTPKQGHWIGRIYQVLDIVALNVGYAKDKPAKNEGGRFVAR